MEQKELRQKFIDSTIHIVAAAGIHKATTKAIATHAGINEVYIYRIFKDKEDLFATTFTAIDNELIDTILKYLPIMEIAGIDMDERCRIFFRSCWKNVVSDREKCSFFIKYYYSHFYNTYSPIERRKAYREVVDRFSPAFKKGTDVWRVFNRILDIVYSTVIKILRDEIPDNEETAEEVFSVVYSAIEPHIAWHDKTAAKAILED